MSSGYDEADDSTGDRSGYRDILSEAETETESTGEDGGTSERSGALPLLETGVSRRGLLKGTAALLATEETAREALAGDEDPLGLTVWDAFQSLTGMDATGQSINGIYELTDQADQLARNTRNEYRSSIEEMDLPEFGEGEMFMDQRYVMHSNSSDLDTGHSDMNEKGMRFVHLTDGDLFKFEGEKNPLEPGQEETENSLGLAVNASADVTQQDIRKDLKDLENLYKQAAGEVNRVLQNGAATGSGDTVLDTIDELKARKEQPDVQGQAKEDLNEAIQNLESVRREMANARDSYAEMARVFAHARENLSYDPGAAPAASSADAIYDDVEELSDAMETNYTTREMESFADPKGYDISELDFKVDNGEILVVTEGDEEVVGSYGEAN
ncbi:MAG: hypothetical protein ABEJ03_06445 [Candidatus Nanohaloarchaea archaeon]